MWILHNKSSHQLIHAIFMLWNYQDVQGYAFYYSYIYVLLSVPWAELEIFKTNETEYQFTRW